jgi:Ran GTPase-activating protein (RanGAP) involved in mRNA processing and transport
MGPQGATALLAAVLSADSTLNTLDLSFNNLGEAALKTIGKQLGGNTSLKELYLQQNKANFCLV